MINEYLQFGRFLPPLSCAQLTCDKVVGYLPAPFCIPKLIKNLQGENKKQLRVIEQNFSKFSKISLDFSRFFLNIINLMQLTHQRFGKNSVEQRFRNLNHEIPLFRTQ